MWRGRGCGNEGVGDWESVDPRARASSVQLLERKSSFEYFITPQMALTWLENIRPRTSFSSPCGATALLIPSPASLKYPIQNELFLWGLEVSYIDHASPLARHDQLAVKIKTDFAA